MPMHMCIYIYIYGRNRPGVPGQCPRPVIESQHVMNMFVVIFNRFENISPQTAPLSAPEIFNHLPQKTH